MFSINKGSNFSGECEAGYYCRSGSNEKTPSVNSAGDAGVCPPGFYCEKSNSILKLTF